MTNVVVTGYGESSNLVSESKMFVEDEAKVLSRVGGVKWSPISKNSVLQQLRVRRLAVIQEEMC